MAANSPSLRLATRQTGPPSKDAMKTAPMTGNGSIPFSSSLDFDFFIFSCTGTAELLLVLTFAPILLLDSRDNFCGSGQLDNLRSLLGVGDRRCGDFRPMEDLGLSSGGEDCLVICMVGVKGCWVLELDE